MKNSPRLRGTVILSSNSLWNIENFRAPLVRGLAAAGYRVVVAAPASADEQARFALPAEVLPLRVDRSGLNPLLDLGLWRTYHRLLRDERPAAYLGWTIKPNIYGALAAAATGVPALLNVSGLGTAFLRSGLFSRFIGLLYRAGFRRAKLVFFQNRDDRDLFVARLLVRPAQARLLPGSGIDLAHFSPACLALSPRAPVFLLVARLLGDKGVREYVAAARIVRRAFPLARCQLLGPIDHDNRSAITAGELAAWVDEGAIDYLGTAQDVRPFIAAASAIVLPSYREGLPRTLLEGAAMGRPLIATDVPGCRDVVVEEVNGLLCAPRDASSLAAAMASMAAMDEARLRAMGAASRALVERGFSDEIVTRAYLDALSELGDA